MLWPILALGRHSSGSVEHINNQTNIKDFNELSVVPFSPTTPKIFSYI